MSVESPEALERSVLESKDREQLLAIASALGVKANSRTKKGDIIDRILDQVRGESPAQGGGSNGDGHPDEAATSALDEVVHELAEAVDAAEAGTEPELERAGQPDVATAESPGGLEVVPSPPDLSDEPLAEWELAFHGDDAHPEARLGSESGATAGETTTDGGAEAPQGDGQSSASRGRPGWRSPPSAPQP